jgi:hypothetical protein
VSPVGAGAGPSGARRERTTYSPGQGLAMAGPRTLGLLDSAAADAGLTAVVDAVLDGAGIDEVVSRLMALGARDLPSFVFAFFEGEHVRLLVRGDAKAVADGGSSYDSDGTSTWRELIVPAPAVLRLHLGPGPGLEPARFELVAGSAPAHAIEHHRLAAAAGAGPVGPATPVTSTPPPAVGPDGYASPPAGSLPPPPPPPPQPPPPPPAVEGPTFDFGHLLGSTRFQHVEDGAVRPGEATAELAEPHPPAPEPVGAPDSMSGATQTFDTMPPLELAGFAGMTGVADAGDPEPPARPADVPLVPPVDAPVSDGDEVPSREPDRPTQTGAAGVILAVPGMGVGRPPTSGPPPSTAPSAAPAPATAAAPVRPPDDGLDGSTVSLDALRARADGAGPATSVQAVRCPDGHPSPPYSDVCRRCGGTIIDRSVTIVPRPDLGRLRFENGPVVPLDRPLLIGRKPPTDAIVAGETARAVRLADPHMVLSRTHVEVRLVDWQVLVLDRDSMNHTFVHIPGQNPFQLRPAEPFPIPPGTTVVLGDATGFTYEVGPVGPDEETP